MRVFFMALPPNFAKNLALGDHFPGMTHKESEKVVFGHAEFYFTAIYGDAARRKINNEIPGLKYSLFFLFRGVTQRRASSSLVLNGLVT